MERDDQDRTTILQCELDEVQSQIAALETALGDKPDYGLGKGDPAVVRWELDRALLQRLRKRVESLEQALSHSSQGMYGICMRCGEQIHLDRLAVLPDTRICIRCAQSGQRT